MTTRAASKRESVEELELRAEERAVELDSLVSQLRDAERQIAQADKRFGELEARRKELSPHAFGGDGNAQLELEAIEDEYAEIARSVRVAKDARPELVRMVSEAKVRLKYARVAIHQARYSALYEELHSLDAGRDALGDQLVDVLDRQSKLYSQMADEVRHYDGDGANNMVTNGSRRHASWLRQRLSRWL